MPSDQVFSKFKAGELRSGGPGGAVVKNPKQAVAIMLSEKRAEKANGGVYPEPKHGKQSTGSKGHNPGSAMKTISNEALRDAAPTEGKLNSSRLAKGKIKTRHEDSIGVAGAEETSPAKPAGYIPGLDDDDGDTYESVMGGIRKGMFHAVHGKGGQTGRGGLF